MENLTTTDNGQGQTGDVLAAHLRGDKLSYGIFLSHGLTQLKRGQERRNVGGRHILGIDGGYSFRSCGPAEATIGGDQDTGFAAGLGVT